MMISQRSLTRLSYVILMLVSGSGCQTLSNLKPFRHHHKEASEVSVPTVDVGGDVVNPGRLEIPGEGMSLRRALSLAGGLRQSATVASVGGVSVDPEIIAEVEKRAREVGKYFDLSRLAVPGPGPKPDQSFEALEEALAAATKQLAQFKESLDIDQSLFTRLERASKQLGGIEAIIEFKRKNNLPLDEDLKAKRKAEVELRAAQVQLQSQAAGASLMLKSQPSNSHLVALQRATGDVPTTYYFPYAIAQTGAVGEINLKPRDLVQVIDYRATSLNADVVAAATGTQNYLVGGYVRNAGSQQVEVGMRINDVISASSPASFGSANDAWTLVRPSLNGSGTEVFVLPTRFATGAFRSARVIPGDVYTYNTIQTVPIVFESLARRALQTPTTPQELREQILADRSRGEVLRDDWKQHVDQTIANGGVGTGVLRNLQGIGQRLNVRSGGSLPLTP